VKRRKARANFIRSRNIYPNSLKTNDIANAAMQSAVAAKRAAWRGLRLIPRILPVLALKI